MKLISASGIVEEDARPQVEIIICTFNGERYIAEQLESIFSQNRKPDLISIYDDASTDGTLAVIHKIIGQNAQQDIEIRIVRNDENLGYVGNFSQGIKAAKADILFLCDQDDRWQSNKIQVALDLLNKTRADLVFSDGRLIGANGEEIPGESVLNRYGLSAIDVLEFSNHAIVRLACRNYINGAAMAIRREAALSAMPVPAGLPHDYWLAVWCALHGGIDVSPKCLYDYRQHSNNVIGVGLNKWYYVWYGILRSPSTPRLIEYARYIELVPRVSALKDATVFVEKLQWLDACVVQTRRLPRLWSILTSTWSGQYRRFGTRYSLVRDLIAVLVVSR